MKIVGYYNQFGYMLIDTETGEMLYAAGNDVNESSGIVPLEHGLTVDTIKEFCQQTGQEIAEELDAEFLGIEYEETDSP